MRRVVGGAVAPPRYPDDPDARMRPEMPTPDAPTADRRVLHQRRSRVWQFARHGGGVVVVVVVGVGRRHGGV